MRNSRPAWGTQDPVRKRKEEGMEGRQTQASAHHTTDFTLALSFITLMVNIINLPRSKSPRRSAFGYIYNEGRPTLNVAGTILWAGVPEEYVREIRMSTCIRVLPSHTGGAGTRGLALSAVTISFFSNCKLEGPPPSSCCCQASVECG